MPTAAEMRARLDAIRARHTALGPKPPIGPLYPRLETGAVLLSRDRRFSAGDLTSRLGQPVLAGRPGLATHSHAAICVSPYEIIDATPGTGLAASPLITWLAGIDQATAIVWQPPAIDRKALTERVRYPYGRTYNRRFADWMPSSGDRAFYCSEYVAHVYRHFFPEHFADVHYLPTDLPEALGTAGFTAMKLSDLPRRQWDSTAELLSTATAEYYKLADLLATSQQKLEQAAAVNDALDMAHRVMAEVEGSVQPQALEIAGVAIRNGSRKVAPALPIQFEQVDDRWRLPRDTTGAARVIGDRLIEEARRHRALVRDLAAAVPRRSGDPSIEEATNYVDLLIDFLPVFRGWVEFAAGLRPSPGDYATRLAGEIATIDAIPADARAEWLPEVRSRLEAIRRAIVAYAPIVTSCVVLDRQLHNHPDADDQAIFDEIASQAMALTAKGTMQRLAEDLQAADEGWAASGMVDEGQNLEGGR